MSDFVVGEIITFYSYKGGTGRSMALANVACVLAQENNSDKDILLIDWDLEAPGLHQFFHGRFDNSKDDSGDLPSGQQGLIDLFYDIRDKLEKEKSQGEMPDVFFADLDIQKYVAKIDDPSLVLMPAGNYNDGGYSTRVNAFDWAKFFEKYPLVIPQFAEYLREKFRYILIDSRTGYTDTSGICTSIMPEKLVAVFTPNRQSLSGVVELIRRAIDYRKLSDDTRPLVIYPLPSRIENAENKLHKEWRFGNLEQGIEGYQSRLESVFADVYGLDRCDLTDYFDEYQLQYVPKYSYGEEIAVLSERSEDRLSLARSFEDFAKKVTSNENSWVITQGSEDETEISTLTANLESSTQKRLLTSKPKTSRYKIVLLVLAVIAGTILLSIGVYPSINSILLSSTSTLHPMITLTSTAIFPPVFSGTVIRPSACFIGPDEYYPVAGFISAGVNIDLLATNSDGMDWLMIQGESISRCWMSSTNVSFLEESIRNLLVFPIGTTSLNTDCYTGPGLTENPRTIIPTGLRLVILGKYSLQDEWLLVVPHDTTESCWIIAKDLSVDSVVMSNIPDAILSAPVIFTPTNTRVASSSNNTLLISLKLVSYDCSNGQATGAVYNLDVSGGVFPYTYSPEVPIYALPNEVVSIKVMSNTANGEPSDIIKFTVPNADDTNVFKCDVTGNFTAVPPPLPTPTLCWPPGHCK